MKYIKKYWLIVLLVIISLGLVIVNITLFFNDTICNYSMNEDNYKMDTKVIISHNKLKIEKVISSDDNDILTKEEEIHKKDNYDTVTNNNVLTANKEISIKDRLKEIDKYKRKGFKCK